MFGAAENHKDKLMNFGPWFAAVLLCVSLLLGTSCDRIKEAVGGSGSGGGDGERELGEAYVLEKRDPEYLRGFTITRTMKMSAPNSLATVTVGKNSAEGTSIRSGVNHTVVQVLGKDRRRVTVQIDKVSNEFRMTGGPTNRDEKKGPLVGQYVLLERTNGVWAARFESGKKANAVERAALDELEKTENAGAEDEVRRLGEEWEEDTEAFGVGTARLRFDRLEDYQGLRCAVVLGTVHLVSETPDGGKVTIEGKVRSYRSLEFYQELYAEIDGTVSGTAYPQFGMTVEMKGPIKITSTAALSNPVVEAAARAAAEAREAAEKAAAEAVAAEIAEKAAAEAAKAAAEKAAEEEGEAEEELSGVEDLGEEAVEE